MKTVMSFKIDKDVRARARTVAKSMGLPLSTIVNKQLSDFANNQRIEFRPPLIPNAKTRKAIDKSLKAIRDGDMRDFSPTFSRAEDAIAWLHKQR